VRQDDRPVLPGIRTRDQLFPAFLPYDPITASYTERDYLDDQVAAFTELGQLASTYGVKIGHEALAWGTVVNRWEQIWEVVDRVDLPNVGVILDSFNQL
jgi:4-hydroxyphenylpyruvate dioxygenase